MTEPRGERGVVALGDGLHAYLQPPGTWGWSNAGLVAGGAGGGAGALLVDTLFDARLTAEMLAALRATTPAAGAIRTLVHTHANGDHCWGSGLVEGAEIVATAASAAEMEELGPAGLAALLDAAPEMGLTGRYLARIFAPFDFAGAAPRAPTRTFSGTLALEAGGRRVELLEVGPAHTRGDLVVHVPDARVVFAGDILFVGVHPVVWAGPVARWVAALDRILALEPEVVVPGHGPLAGVAEVRRLRAYLLHVEREARRFFDAGVPAAQAARAIALDAYDGWGDPERLVVNVASVYRHLAAARDEASGTPDGGAPDVLALFGEMAAYAAERGLHGLSPEDGAHTAAVEGRS